MTDSERQRHDQFLRLYVEHEEAIRAFVRSLVPTREDAREVMQEVAAVLWRKFDELLSPPDFRRWAFGVARFEALAFHRDRSRDRHVFSDETLTLLAGDAERAAESLEAEREALHNCLKKLPMEHRSLLWAAYEPGAQINELAKQLGRSAVSLYKLLHRIRLTLADCAEKTLRKEGLA